MRPLIELLMELLTGHRHTAPHGHSRSPDQLTLGRLRLPNLNTCGKLINLNTCDLAAAGSVHGLVRPRLHLGFPDLVVLPDNSKRGVMPTGETSRGPELRSARRPRRELHGARGTVQHPPRASPRKTVERSQRNLAKFLNQNSQQQNKTSGLLC